MSVKVYIPLDTTACAKGADAIAEKLQQLSAAHEADVEIIRTGSRGLFWLEPLLEVDTEQGRLAYGPVEESQMASLWQADFLHGGDHPLSLGDIETHPFLQRQQRLTFARVGLIDPLSVEDFCRHGGYEGLSRALALSPQARVDEVRDSGLRGRGGAAFPTGIKWQTVLDAKAPQKYIVCNADEGDSGTFADRMLMEGDPFCLIEGMTLAGLAVGATEGYIYLREEYPKARDVLLKAISLAEQSGYLGDDIQGCGRGFHLHLRIGAGAYICGEETSLLESLEGKRGMVRAKPPLPALEGLFGQPTVVNNVITLATIPFIFARGAAAYQAFGMGRSRGTLPFQLAGNVRQGGLVELAFGPSLAELVNDFGGGTRSGLPARAIQVGGPLGAYLPEHQWQTPLDYEAFAEIDGVLGHGGVVVFDETVDMAQQARFSMEFCVAESCGKCTPCRIGSTRGVEVIDRIAAQDGRSDEQIQLLRDLCGTMMHGSLCAMGGMTPFPVLSALNHFAEDFRADQPAQEITHD